MFTFNNSALAITTDRVKNFLVFVSLIQCYTDEQLLLF